MKEAKEKQNQAQLDEYFAKPIHPMGPWTTNIWRHDPRHLAFLCARYKFVAKMLEGRSSVLEVGCGDAFGTPIVCQTVGQVTGIDFEENLIEDNRKRNERPNLTFDLLDITKEIPAAKFDAAFCLDVIEHIPPAVESTFIANTCAALKQESIFIIGTPNVTASPYASKYSMEGHINLKSGEGLRELMNKYFHHSFVFSMNDEVVHTGFSPMAHYLIAMGVQKR